MTISQKGFSSIGILGLLVVGVVAGTILVQSGVNFLPKAAEQESLHPSKGRTKNCKDVSDRNSCLEENNKICAADEVIYCDNRQGSPRAIRKSGGYYTDDPTDPLYGNKDESGCVFDYWEISSKNSECGKSESKSGDVVYTTEKEAEKLDEERGKGLKEREDKAKGNQGNSNQSSDPTANDTSPVCKVPDPEQVTNAFRDEKVAGNLARFYAILEGAPEMCVPADLGVAPQKTAKTAGGVTGREMLCSGSDGALTWRVIDGAKLVPSVPQPDPSKELTKKYYEEGEGKKWLDLAKEKAGLGRQPTGPANPDTVPKTTNS